MSPRSFRLGLLVFLAMSGALAAKLSMGGVPEKPVSWYADPNAGSHAGGQTAAKDAKPKLKILNAQAKQAQVLETAAHVAPPAAEADADLIAAVKLELKTRGYAVTADTVRPAGLDLKTRAAILAFEADNKMRLTAEASQQLLHHLLLGASQHQAGADTPPSERAREVIRHVQSSLRQTGKRQVGSDGAVNRDMREAIEAFERAHGMEVTGRISGRLVERLERMAGQRTAEAR